AEDARVVDQDVAPLPPVECGLDDAAGAVEVGDAVVARHGLGPERRDLLAHRGGGVGLGSAAAHVAADVVDDDLRALAGECQRNAASDPPTGTGDDGDLPIEHAHACGPPRRADSRRANTPPFEVSI